MSVRCPKSGIRARLDYLNKISKRRYELSISSPGDGWTRYQLFLCPKVGTYLEREMTQVCNSSEIWEVLGALTKYAEIEANE